MSTNATLTTPHQAPLQGRTLAIPFTKATNPDAALDDSEMRLPFLNKIPDNLRNHFVVRSSRPAFTPLGIR